MVNGVNAGAPVRLPKMAELVADQLRGLIIRGDLVEGEALPSESEVMKQFDVSRPTLREAFRILEAEHLIEIKRGAGGGARVRHPSVDVAARHVGALLQLDGAMLDEVFGARLVIEPAAAALVAARPDHREVAETLAALVQEEEDAAGDKHRYATTVAAFHERLVELSENKVLTLLSGVISEVVRASTEHVITLPAAAKPDEIRRAVRAHRKLVRLISEGASERVETYWRQHMSAVRESYVEHYGTATVVELFNG